MDKTIVQIFNWSITGNKPDLNFTKLFSSITEAYNNNLSRVYN